METVTLHIPVPTELLLSVNESPQEFGEELKRWAAVSMYYFGKISLAQAASLAGYHRYDFEKLLASLNIPISLLDEKDAAVELARLSEM